MKASELKALNHFLSLYKKYRDPFCMFWRMEDDEWVSIIDCYSLWRQGYLRKEDGPWNHTSFYLTDKAIQTLA